MQLLRIDTLVVLTESTKATGRNPTGGNNESQQTEAHYQYRKERYSTHSASRRTLDDLAFKTSERYDHWVLTLAGGALAISLTFLEKIAPNPAQDTILWIGIAWLAFILAILTGFSAIFFSRKAIYRAIEICDENYQIFNATTSEEKPDGDAPPERVNYFNRYVDWLNFASIFFLAVGTITMCFFALANMNGTMPARGGEHQTNGAAATNGTSNHSNQTSSAVATNAIPSPSNSLSIKKGTP